MPKGKGDAQHVGYRIGMKQESEHFAKRRFILKPFVPVESLEQKEEAERDHDGYEGCREAHFAEVVSKDVDGGPHGECDRLAENGQLGCCLFLQLIHWLLGLFHSNYKVEECDNQLQMKRPPDDIIVLAIIISPDCMNRSQRKIGGGFDVSLQLAERSLIINITHPSKNRVYFSRLSDSSLSNHLREIADNSKQLYQLMVDLGEEKLVMSGNDELVIMMDVGKKVKQYAIPLEKVEISSEEALKKRVEDLEKELERKEFQARFYKEQYHFLLQNLQLRPDTQQLERIYKRDMQFVFERQGRVMKSQSMFEKESDMTMSSLSARSQKVGSFEKEKKQVLKCPKMHPLISEPTSHPYFKCNLCRRQIPKGELNYQCRPCDFDACGNCISTPPQNQKYCPKQHMITFGCASNYFARSCDLCRTPLAFTKAYTCLECDYDVCRNCLK